MKTTPDNQPHPWSGRVVGDTRKQKRIPKRVEKEAYTRKVVFSLTDQEFYRFKVHCAKMRCTLMDGVRHALAQIIAEELPQPPMRNTTDPGDEQPEA